MNSLVARHTPRGLLLLLVGLLGVLGHMVMVDPPARRLDRRNPGPHGAVDYDITSPLSPTAPGTFPCKGHPAQSPRRSLEAGKTYRVKFGGTANHDGGHCQFALSYDGGKTFTVIHTLLRECLRKKPYEHPVPIPKTAPEGTAVFAWTWINAVGNREYYMSCSDVKIANSLPREQQVLEGLELLVVHTYGYPLNAIPEFGGNNNDRRQIFDARKKRTVRAVDL